MEEAPSGQVSADAAGPAPSERPLEVTRPRPRPAVRPVSRPVRVLASLAVLVAVGTFIAAQVDFLRRHTLGIPSMDPRQYWIPQLRIIWARGLGAALLLGAAAFALHRGRRAD